MIQSLQNSFYGDEIMEKFAPFLKNMRSERKLTVDDILDFDFNYVIQYPELPWDRKGMELAISRNYTSRYFMFEPYHIAIMKALKNKTLGDIIIKANFNADSMLIKSYLKSDIKPKFSRLVKRNDEIEKIITKSKHYVDWDYSTFKSYSILSEKFISENVSSEWNLSILSKTNLSAEFYINNDHLDFDYHFITSKLEFPTEFIEKHIHKNLNFKYITTYAPIWLIEKYITKSWDFYSITDIVDLEFIQDNPTKNWNKNILTNRIDLSEDFLSKTFYFMTYDFKTLTQRVSLEFIENNPSSSWDSDILSSKFGLNENFIARTISKLPYNFKKITSLVSLNFILENPDYDWCWYNIHNFQGFSLAVIKRFPNKNYNLNEIASNENLSFLLLEYVAFLEWPWDILSKNRAINFYIYSNLIDKPWDIYSLEKRGVVSHESVNKMLGLDRWDELEKIVIKYRKKFSDKIFMNPSISEKFIEKTIDDCGNNLSKSSKLPFYISKNPNVTISLLEKFPNFEWNYNELLINMTIKSHQIYKLYDIIPSKISIKKFFNYLSKNPNWKEHWLDLYPDERWDVNYLVKNHRCKEKIQKLFPDLPWYKIEDIDDMIKEDDNQLTLEDHKLAFDIMISKNCFWTGIYDISIWSNRYLTLNLLDELISCNKIVNWKEIERNIFRYESAEKYWSRRRHATITNTKKYSDELVGVAWGPERMTDWCLDEIEKNSLKVRWN